MRQLLQGLISYVGGFTVIAELNDEQVQCLSGGPVLCALSQTINPEAGGIGGTGGSTGGRYSERARAALRAAMTQEGPTLVQSFWHSLMAQRDLLVSHTAIINGFTENKGGLKLLGYLLDTSHTQLLQLTQYLVLVASAAHPYSELLPDVDQLFRPKGHRLMADQLPLAFHLCRPGLPPYGVLPSDDEKDRQTTVAKLGEAVKPFLPGQSEEALDGLSLNFYLTFWRLSLYDIYVPCDSYKKQIASMEREMVEMQGAADGRATAATPNPTKQTIKRAKKEIHRLREHIDKLRVEETLQLENHHRVLERLRRECGGWWKQEVGNEQATVALVKWMLAQRVMLSVQDALFCAHFVKLLVTLHPPGFQLLDFYNVATTLLMVLVQCCTESEARWFGVFLRDIMHYVKDLRSIGDSSKFAEYVAGNSAFYRHYRPYGEKDAEYLKLSELKKGHAKWEGRVCKALKPGLEKSADWSEKRNALTVLISCHEYCPVHYRSARAVMHQLEALSKDQGQPPDIKTMAGGLLSKMRQREDSLLDRPPPKPAHDHSKPSEGQSKSAEAHGKSTEAHNKPSDSHARTTSSSQGHALNALSSPSTGVKRSATDSPNSTTTSPEGKKLRANDERSERSSARERGRPPRE
ncbi:hypothetical protein FOZ63_033743 [Perkinsus olseni]|uniref:THO complex subunitTHOC2 C-terminal domain-containing protein n=1 Tax=Perkinsus olseni TaxID=32597 RepID=A0A7J6TIQ7_PEROL|nr:hypothetical protein FOZ63_033743 [Perkinsus olseni]